MRDAVGGSLLLNLVVIFTGIVIIFFVGIIAYSKAYKVKNRIIELVERNEGYPSSSEDAEFEKEIITELSKVGYRVVSERITNDKCSRDSSRGNCVNKNTTYYYYCVCEHSDSVSSGTSFEVITYVQFEFPVIGDLITFPVKGETKVLGKSYDY